MSDDRNSTRLVDEAESIAEDAKKSVQSAKLLLDSGLVYDSANALDAGVSTFTALIEREDMREMLEF